MFSIVLQCPLQMLLLVILSVYIPLLATASFFSAHNSNISNISTGKTQEQKYIPQQKHALEVSLVLQNEMVFIVALFLVSLQSRKAIACNPNFFTPIILGMDLVSGHHHPLSPYRQQA